MGVDAILVAREARVKLNLGRFGRLRDALSDSRLDESDCLGILDAGGFDSQTLRDLAENLALAAGWHVRSPEDSLLEALERRDDGVWALRQAVAFLTMARDYPRDLFRVVSDAEDEATSAFDFEDLRPITYDDIYTAGRSLGLCPLCIRDWPHPGEGTF